MNNMKSSTILSLSNHEYHNMKAVFHNLCKHRDRKDIEVLDTHTQQYHGAELALEYALTGGTAEAKDTFGEYTHAHIQGKEIFIIYTPSGCISLIVSPSFRGDNMNVTIGQLAVVGDNYLFDTLPDYQIPQIYINHLLANVQEQELA